MRKFLLQRLFLVLVPQGLELLLALVFGDFLPPFLLEIAHNDTTLCSIVNKPIAS
jgi:hypothetical protein